MMRPETPKECELWEKCVLAVLPSLTAYYIQYERDEEGDVDWEMVGEDASFIADVIVNHYKRATTQPVQDLDGFTAEDVKFRKELHANLRAKYGETP